MHDDNDDDDIPIPREMGTPLAQLMDARASRRALLGGAAFLTAAGVAAPLPAFAGPGSSLRFRGLKQRITEGQQVAEGYAADVLIRWGDPVMADAPAFDARNQSAAAQARQFGYNNDFLAFLPLPKGSATSDRGLLFANHEYVSARLMHPEHRRVTGNAARYALERAAHGGSVVEIARGDDGRWRVIPGSRYARRITADTEMTIAGPAAGHPRLQTAEDPSGTRVLGTLNNCAGGKTPWGTVLMAEENFHFYFSGAHPEETGEARNFRRYGIGRSSARYRWGETENRFNIAREPHGPNRFGWMVEVDPYDPASMPVKRTALGRFKHEGATVTVNRDGRVVVYSGDDQRFEYLYRFVSARAYDPHDPESARTILDEGTLSVARFDETTVRWLPLVFGEGPLTLHNGFASQADVLIETRRAADLLGATPLDRPEDVEPSPVNGRVYVTLTNNSKRKPDQVDWVNPRAKNTHGQIVELTPPGGYGAEADHTADLYFWNHLLLAGDAASGAHYHPDTEAWISSPDNCAFDARGRIWIATDQGSAQTKNAIPDGLYGCDVDGPGRALLKCLYAAPAGAEACGPEFTPDGRTVFLAVQHPGDGKGATFENPASRWPDFDPNMPPRPAVVAISRWDGGEIGG